MTGPVATSTESPWTRPTLAARAPNRHQPTPLHLSGPLYLSLDMDVLDPAFAPGVSHYEPGGFSVRDVLHILHGIGAGTGVPIVGADLVEFNPSRDPGGVTAMVGAKFYKEILGRMLA